ncbi:MAG: hypothetical protein JXP73_07885 [Deltaproteobacteria bacterium]|nr:hypothetical protein [Deltaproteobacteria bacterium]
MNDDLECFARLYVRRKLAAAGVELPERDLERLVRVARRTLPSEEDAGNPPSDPAHAEETHRLTRFTIYFRRADITVELNANTGEPMAWICSQLAQGNTPASPAEALRVAEVAAAPPANAVLVEHGYEEMAGEPVFVAHWEHRENSVPVERDYIRVLVGGHSGRVFAVQRRWHDVDLNPSMR